MSKQFFSVVYNNEGEQSVSEVPISFAKGEPYAVGAVLRKMFKVSEEQAYTLMNMDTNEIFDCVDLLPINPEHLYQIFIEYSEPEEGVVVVSEVESSSSDSEDIKITGESSKASCTPETLKADTASTNATKGITWPVGVSLTPKVPVDVDGSQLFATHFKGQVAGGRKGNPLLQLDFFANNRTWSEAGNTSWKRLGDLYGKERVSARAMHCLGEYICKQKDCVFFQVGGRHFVKRVTKRSTGKGEGDFLGHKVTFTLMNVTLLRSQFSKMKVLRCLRFTEVSCVQ